MNRNIFEYHDGEKQVFGDPLEIERGMRLELGDPAKAVAAINQIDTLNAPPEVVLSGFQAQKALADAVRTVFVLTPFDRMTGRGCTDSEALALWRQFSEFLSQKKTAAES